MTRRRHGLTIKITGIFLLLLVDGFLSPRLQQSSRSYSRYNRYRMNYPLIITVGPMCCGKTTALLALGNSLGGERICDVAIDDHPDVYHKVPTGVMIGLNPLSQRDDIELFGRRVSRRLMEDATRAQIMVARRLLKLITAEQFAKFWYTKKDLYPIINKSLEPLYVEVVEKVVASGVTIKTETLDLFVAQGLYPSGVMDSTRRLRRECHNHQGAVAWGNTNTHTKDFKDVLVYAEESERPVKFMRWGHELAAVSLEDLLVRNLVRFAKQGRYIPPQAIVAALDRVLSLYSRTDGGKEEALLAAAGYIADAEGLVKAIPRPVKETPPRRRNSNIRPQDRYILRRGGSASSAQSNQRDAHPARPHPSNAFTVSSDISSLPLRASQQQPQEQRQHPEPEERKPPPSQEDSQSLQWRHSSIAGSISGGSSAAVAFLPAPSFGEWLNWWALRAGGTIASICKQSVEDVLAASSVMQAEWGKFKSWSRVEYVRADVEPNQTLYIRPKNGTESGPRKTYDYLDVDTIDLARIIMGDKNARFKF